MKLRNLISSALIALAAATPTFAFNYDLVSSAATVVDGNLTSPFYEINPSTGIEGGTAANLFSSTWGGDADAGFWVKISFDGNPQPFLTSAFLKAADQYLLWDAADLLGFNTGIFDSITLWNSGAAGSGIGHYTGGKTPQWKFQGTSHAGINGRPGTRVPDTASTLALLALGLGSLGLIARRRKA